MLQQMEAQLDYLQAQKEACTLYAINNYSDDIALPLYLIEEGFQVGCIDRNRKINKGIRDYYLTKGNRGIHVVIIPEEQGGTITPNILRRIVIENKQNQSPAYVMAGTYETAALYDEIVKTNPKLKKVAAGLYQLVPGEH